MSAPAQTASTKLNLRLKYVVSLRLGRLDRLRIRAVGHRLVGGADESFERRSRLDHIPFALLGAQRVGIAVAVERKRHFRLILALRAEHEAIAIHRAGRVLDDDEPVETRGKQVFVADLRDDHGVEAAVFVAAGKCVALFRFRRRLCGGSRRNGVRLRRRFGRRHRLFVRAGDQQRRRKQDGPEFLHFFFSLNVFKYSLCASVTR